MIKKALLYLYTAIAWIYIVLIFAGHFCFSSLYKLFFKDKEWAVMRSAVPFLKSAFWIGRTPLLVRGAENIPKEGTFILVANHQSYADIPIFLCAIPRKFSFLAKRELLNVPILGWDLKSQGHVPVDRGNPKTSVKELQRLEQELNQGRSLLFFPEGTRSPDGVVAPFKKGAFLLAVRTGVQVIPCRVEGSIDVWRKNSLLIGPAKMTVTIFPPIQVQKSDKAHEKEAIEQLMQKARSIICSSEK